MKQFKTILTILSILVFVVIAAFGVSYFLETQKNVDPEGSKAAIPCVEDTDCGGGKICSGGFCAAGDCELEGSQCGSGVSCCGDLQCLPLNGSSLYSCQKSGGKSRDNCQGDNSVCNTNEVCDIRNTPNTCSSNALAACPLPTGKTVSCLDISINNKQCVYVNKTDGISCPYIGVNNATCISGTCTAPSPTPTPTPESSSYKTYAWGHIRTVKEDGTYDGTQFWRKDTSVCGSTENFPVSSTLNINGFTHAEYPDKCSNNLGSAVSADRPHFIMGLENEPNKFELRGIPSGYECAGWEYRKENINGSMEKITQGTSCDTTLLTLPVLSTPYKNLHYLVFFIKKTAQQCETVGSQCGSGVTCCSGLSCLPLNGSTTLYSCQVANPKSATNCQGDNSVCTTTQRCDTSVNPNVCTADTTKVCTQIPTGKSASCLNITIANQTCDYSATKPDGTACGTNQVCQSGACTNITATNYATVKGLNLKIKLANRPEKTGYTYPTTFIGVWRDTGTKSMLEYKIVGLTGNTTYNDTNFLASNGTTTYTLLDTDYLLIKPEGYLSKAYQLKNIAIENNIMKITDTVAYEGGDTILDVGSFDTVNILDRAFYKTFFGRDNAYDYYYLDYNGDTIVNILDGSLQNKSEGKSGATKNFEAAISPMRTALETHLYKSVKN